MNGRTITETLALAAFAADGGREVAKGMVSQHGNAAASRIQTIGIKDPDAYVGSLILKGVLPSHFQS